MVRLAPGKALAPIVLAAVFLSGDRVAVGGGLNLRQQETVFQIASGICPQQRKTARAPGRVLQKTNPLPASPENFNRGKQLFQKDAKPTACGMCHGRRGNGNGRLAPKMEPPPRNFTCADTMKNISDGQMVWIIRNGSKGTAMPAHKFSLTDKEIWQLILYIREFAR